MQRPRSAKISRICPGDSAANSSSLQVSRNSLAFFFAEAVGHVAEATLPAVNAITVTRELVPPPLQRRKPHVQQQGQLAGLRWTGFSGQAPSLTSEAGHRP